MKETNKAIAKETARWYESYGYLGQKVVAHKRKNESIRTLGKGSTPQC